MSPTMAISLRRAALSCRKVVVILRTSRYFSHVASPAYFRNPAPSSCAVPNSPTIDFLLEFRRGFAKRRRQSDEDDIGGGDGDGNRVEAVNMGPKIKAVAISKLGAAVDALLNALSKLRGMESPEMLDHIIVEIGGGNWEDATEPNCLFQC